MSIEASAPSTVSTNSTAQTSQVSASVSKDSSKKTSEKSSFKDELDKVSVKEDKKEDSSTELKSDNKDFNVQNSNKSDDKIENNSNIISSQANPAIDMMNVNQILYNNIQQMQNADFSLDTLSQIGKSSGLFNGSDKSIFGTSVSMSEDDAQFFINLTKTNDVSSQNVIAQAQNLINSGADVSEVVKSTKISQTLLDAINTARENNQPLRIDFDQNISVVLRINRDGVLSANFIPADKAVEQYLRNNIDSLKATFRENELPYSDLSYSNSSKRENEKRRNQQQGE